MRALVYSPSNSPARKRQRLSSPTYDEQVSDLSQEDLAAFDALEAQLSQGSQSPKRNDRNTRPDAKAQRVKAIADALKCSFSEKLFPGSDSQPENLSSTQATSAPTDDPDNPFTTRFSTAKGHTSNISAPLVPGLVSTSSTNKVAQPDYERSPSPEEPPQVQQSFLSWFEPAPIIAPVAFQSASSGLTELAPLTSGFMRASKKGWIAPSSTALANAKEKMRKIWEETDSESLDTSSSRFSAPKVDNSENAFTMVSNLPASPLRPALRSVENSFDSPSTPTPLGVPRPSGTAKAMFSSPIGQTARYNKPKAFKPPLLTQRTQRAAGNRAMSSPLSHVIQLSSLSTFTTAGSRHPLASEPVTIGATSNHGIPVANGPTSFTTPARMSQRVKKDGPSPFVTPFKVGMKPGQPGRSQLEHTTMDTTTHTRKTKESWLIKERPRKAKEINRIGVFDLTIPPNRITLASSGLRPQQYSTGELETMGIDAEGLSNITPTTALYYSFHTASTTPFFLTSSLEPAVVLGPTEALSELLERGCTLATKPWVDNHWCLILWKLAGMVSLDPGQESDPTQKRWCWSEVMHQLFYRYERELQGGIRSPFRLITTQDAPASCPMVLCISGIIWSEAGRTDDGMPIAPHPELEVTDGWYRLRAQVDPPLARAIRRGVIRIGRKIGVAGARLSSERKEPSEVLDAYNSTKLVIFGNSSHMAPWYTKMGFQRGPCISTLHSLTPDGGVVTAMDFVVIKAHPIAFFEFIEDKNGKRHREGPLNESEENLVNEQWKRRREVTEAKLRSELDKKLHRYVGYIDRLQRRAGAQFQIGEDNYPPDNIENLYEELEDPTDAGRVLANLTPNEAGWLARHVADQIEKERSFAADAIESELKNLCPSREVRSFRVLVIQDSRTLRRPAHRKAQLTVWDVFQLALFEGHTAGKFEMGQRFLVTNLIPTQPSAWMDCDPGSEIYLSTRRDSKWTTIRSK